MSSISRMIPAVILGLGGRSKPTDAVPKKSVAEPLTPELPNVDWAQRFKDIGPAHAYAPDPVTDAEVAELKRLHEEPAPAFVLPDWMKGLRLQQQSVLILALRGPDGFPKHSPVKPILRAYRACVLKAAYYGRPIRPFGDVGDNFMRLDEFYDDDRWAGRVKEFFDGLDALNHHYITHLIYGIEILGYKFPDTVLSPDVFPGRGPQFIRERWHSLYLKICEDEHHPPETEEQMDRRLCDWGHQFWDGE